MDELKVGDAVKAETVDRAVEIFKEERERARSRFAQKSGQIAKAKQARRKRNQQARASRKRNA